MYTSNINGRRHKWAFFLLLIPIVVFALGSVVMLLWNAIIPEITSAPTITYWQAMGLLVLSRILFGNFRPGVGGSKPPFRNPGWREKMMNLTEEERQKLRTQWKDRCKPRV